MKKSTVLMMALISVVSLSLLVGCANGAGVFPRGGISLPDTIWVLDQMFGDAVNATITLRFDDSRISGNASCNNYFSDYTLDGDKISFGPVGATMMACINMDDETHYLSSLAGVTGVRVDETQLVLSDGSGKEVLVFSPMRHAALEDEVWVLTGWNTGSAISSLIIDSEITLELADGQVSGTAGCNNYFGSYQLKDDTLSFGPIASTEIACMEPEGVMEQETGYLKALAQVASFHIEGTALTMYDKAGTTLLTFIVQ
ncbi:MAG: META domain-containing protein [Anaerolineae bacterium]|nr:META domain-containing protein [Anaerolineae bacterium]